MLATYAAIIEFAYTAGFIVRCVREDLDGEQDRTFCSYDSECSIYEIMRFHDGLDIGKSAVLVHKIRHRMKLTNMKEKTLSTLDKALVGEPFRKSKHWPHEVEAPRTQINRLSLCKTGE